MRITLLAAVFLAVLGVSVASDVEAAVRRPTSISAQGLGPALETLAKERNFQILYISSVVDGLHTNGAAGELTDAEALTKLLNGTGLTFRYLDEKTVTVVGHVTADNTILVDTRRSGDTANTADVGPRSLQLVQNENQSAQQSHSSSSGQSPEENKNPENPPKDSKNEEFEEIVVTGSHIRGQTPIGAKVISISREQLDATGRSTVQDFLQVLTQNFAATRNEIQGGAGNWTRATGVDLRGLGAGSTLTLVNGRRQAASGDNGDFVDVASIPVAAIERIEVLTDGASAIYGSDAIGGVINIILRKDYNGAETTARVGTAGGDSTEVLLSQLLGHSWENTSLMLGYQYYHRETLLADDRDYVLSLDKTANGGSDFRTYYSNPGNILGPDFTVAYSIPPNQDGTSLTPADLIPGQVNFGDSLAGLSLLPENESHSVFLSAKHALGDSVELFLDGRYSQRDLRFQSTALQIELLVPPTNPFYVDPFGTGDFIFVAYDFMDDLGPEVTVGDAKVWNAAAGARIDLPAQWSLTFASSFGAERGSRKTETVDFFGTLMGALFETDPARAFNPFADGSNTNAAVLESLGMVISNEYESRVWSSNLLLEGALAQLPAGAARAAVGADYRVEALDSSRAASTLDDLERNVTAVFGEVALPLLPGRAEGARPLLETSLAGRYESYSDFGTAFNPRIGIQLSPLKLLSLRATWGTSYRAPNLIDLDTDVSGGVPSVSLNLFPDPTSPSGLSRILLRSGNNPDVQEETADIWSLGFDLQDVYPGMRLSASYFDIDYQDRVVTPGPLPVFFILNEEALWPEVIDRSPTPEELTDLCSQLLFGDCAATPPVAVIDARKRNISALTTRGVDFEVGQRLQVTAGEIDLALQGTYVFDYARRTTPTSEAIEVVNTLGAPPRLRMRGGLTLTRGSFTTHLAANYQSSYRASALLNARRLDPWTTVDASLSYRPKMDGIIFEGIELALRAVNLFDEDPPFHNTQIGFDVSGATPIGRLVSVELRKQW